MNRNKWQIPHKSKTAEYQHCRYICLRYGKPWPDLTEEEKAGVRKRESSEKIAASAVKVLAALKSGKPMVHSEIVESTGLCSRTVRHAIKRLKSRGLITERFNWRDGRKWLYQIKPQPREGAQQEAMA